MANTSKKINFNQYGFDKQLGSFDSLMGTAKISGKTDRLTGSEGQAIDRLNECLDNYDQYCEYLNEVFAATSAYLHKVSKNINDCEEGTTVR
ncbi:MAG: hypothetical protein J6U54_22875 [Clostridiales bacterium]|nr:hypothetical protein [Clostridiales bacterium]